MYDSVWSYQTRLQRDFAVFGGEFLMAQDAGNLRGFFDSFFRLPLAQWTVRALRALWSGIGRCVWMDGCVYTYIRVPVRVRVSPPNPHHPPPPFPPPPSPTPTSQGFLAGWPGLPNNAAHESWPARLEFGIRLFLLAPLPLKFALAYAGVTSGGLPFFRSVTPLADLLPPFPPAEAEAGAGGVGSGAPAAPVESIR